MPYYNRDPKGTIILTTTHIPLIDIPYFGLHNPNMRLIGIPLIETARYGIMLFLDGKVSQSEDAKHTRLNHLQQTSFP